MPTSKFEDCLPDIPIAPVLRLEAYLRGSAVKHLTLAVE